MLPTPISGTTWKARDPSQAYLYRRSPTHLHRGIDFAARAGTAVWSVAPGVVEHSSAPGSPGFDGYGRVVVIRHPDGARALYAHLESATVERGQQVSEGQQLGTVGTTRGTVLDPSLRFVASRAHLHFEVARNSYPMKREAERLDPVGYAMSDPDLPRDSLERWKVLDRAISKLYHAIPEDRREGAVNDMLNAWKEALEFAPTMGPAMRGAALSDWIDRYNAARAKFIAQGGAENAAPIARDRNRLAEDATAVAETATAAAEKVGDWASNIGTLIVVGGLVYLVMQANDRAKASA